MTVLTWNDLFEEIAAIAGASREPSRETEGRERLIRLFDKHAGDDFGDMAPVIDTLCARFGLYPYRGDTAPSSEIEAIATELHRSPAGADDEAPFYFNAKQLEVFQKLIAGESVILSAPTSFGKSALLDQLLGVGKWGKIVIIVPTIALIDETRRRLAKFRGQYEIVTHAAEHEKVTGPRIVYVLTQERFLELPALDVDFFVIDEFYKLSPSSGQDSRQGLLNITWRRLLDTGAQYYLTGPNISSLSERLDDDLRARLMVTDFRTVAVNYTDWSAVPAEDRLTHLIAHRGELQDPLLVFVSATDRTEEVALALPPAQPATTPNTGSVTAAQVAEWLGSNFDSDWSIVRAVRQGVGVHNGKLPRSVQRIMIRLFNEGLLQTLVCTTTLIEGVNTAARTVVIYDKKIDRKAIDYFTFGNISGRAGRAFRHFVGDVVSYMPTPKEVETIVDIPIESQTASASLAALVQLDETEWTTDTAERLAPIIQQDALSLATIRANRGVNPELQVALARDLRDRTSAHNSAYAWTGTPNTDQLRSTLTLGFDSLVESSQKRGMNADILIARLQVLMHNPADFRARVDAQMQFRRQGQTRSDIVSDQLAFERDWVQFRIPAMLRSLQAIQSEVLQDVGMKAGNYEYFLRNVGSAFLAGGIAELDEYGLPTPLALRLLDGLGSMTDTAIDRLGQLQQVRQRPNGVSDPVEQWIVDDVLDGYFGPDWRSPNA